ncbi:hypothetical protein E5676_scaffold234G00680 [Cucumis melo var. makuwa]|nr:hypothetical protein E5676_scaffold234G00680 [Cucumis melo var. makuwa]
MGKACGGLIKVAEETKTAKNLIEAKLKIRYNYLGFLPANVKIFDQEGNKFIIHVVTHSEGKWLMERNVQLHGTFKRQAAASFDEFNPKSEQFFFDGMKAISPDYLPAISGSHKSSTPEKSSALKSVRKRKVDIPTQSDSVFNTEKPKRKVSFNSPSNKTNFFNPESAPANHSPSLSSLEKKQKVSRERSIKKKSTSMQYKIKANQRKGDLNVQPIQVVAHDLEAVKKGLSLTVDLEDLSMLDPSKSIEDHHSSDNAEVIDITNTEVVPETPEMKMPTSENLNSSFERNYRKLKHTHRRRHYYREKEEKEKDPDLEAFKKQLVSWLKENGLKLSTDNETHEATTSTNVMTNKLGSGLGSKGDGALGTSIVK